MPCPPTNFRAYSPQIADARQLQPDTRGKRLPLNQANRPMADGSISMQLAMPPMADVVPRPQRVRVVRTQHPLLVDQQRLEPRHAPTGSPASPRQNVIGIGSGEIGVIWSVTQSFCCHSCTRVWVSTEGVAQSEDQQVPREGHTPADDAARRPPAMTGARCIRVPANSWRMSSMSVPSLTGISAVITGGPPQHSPPPRPIDRSRSQDPRPRPPHP